MNREMKFRAILKKEARGRDPYQTEVVIFTLENMMRGKVVFAYPEHWDFCEYTGLLDKNGKEIYEGDIIRILYTDWPSQSAEKNGRYSMSLEDYKKSISSIGFVQWGNDRWVINFGKGRFGDDETGRMSEGAHGEKEIIGNIYSNPDLLTPPDTK